MSGAKGTDLDAPTPPGGPNRTDAPAGPDSPGQEAQDPGPGTERVTKPEGDGDLPPITHEDTQDEAAEERQEENAETSLDQPSQ